MKNCFRLSLSKMFTTEVKISVATYLIYDLSQLAGPVELTKETQGEQFYKVASDRERAALLYSLGLLYEYSTRQESKRLSSPTPAIGRETNECNQLSSSAIGKMSSKIIGNIINYPFR
jgi:hypothetical protein